MYVRNDEADMPKPVEEMIETAFIRHTLLRIPPKKANLLNRWLA